MSISGLTEASGGHADRQSLKGAGYRHKLAGLGFTIGSLAMIGIPLLTGFVSKYLFASAATSAATGKMVTAWIALALSTVLNTAYFMRTVLVIYTTVPDEQRKAEGYRPSLVENGATIGLIAAAIGLGILSSPVISALREGLSIFG